MTDHTSHQMRLTSLLVKWGSWNEQQFNDKFRQEVERKIILFHKDKPNGLTDEELLNLFGNPDTNLVRPRRCDLSSNKRKTRPPILYDSQEKRRNKHDRICIVWKLNPENLNKYLEE